MQPAAQDVAASVHARAGAVLPALTGDEAATGAAAPRLPPRHRQSLRCTPVTTRSMAHRRCSPGLPHTVESTTGFLRAAETATELQQSAVHPRGREPAAQSHESSVEGGREIVRHRRVRVSR